VPASKLLWIIGGSQDRNTTYGGAPTMAPPKQASQAKPSQMSSVIDFDLHILGSYIYITTVYTSYLLEVA
jgi:hypothetical protein